MKPHTVQAEIDQAERSLIETKLSIKRYNRLGMWFFMMFAGAAIWVIAILMF